MSTSVGSIHYDLGLKTDKFDSAVNSVNAKTQRIGKDMQSIGKKMTAFITLPVALGMGFAIKSASDLEETLNKVDVSFGKQSQVVKDWAKTSIYSMGLAKQSALDAAALFGDMGTSMGLTKIAAANMSMGLVQLGADLSSFKNISFKDAQDALAGVFTGETESLKHLGIVMTETNLEAFAMSQGIKKNIQDMTQAEKVQLRYAYIMSVTKNAQGDFTRTASSTANQIRINKEKFKELSAQIGQILIPIANKLMSILSKLLDTFSKLSPGVQKFILILVGIVAVIGPIIIIIGTLLTSIAAIATVLGVTVGAVIVGGAAIAGVVLAIGALAFVIIKNWDKIKTWIVNLWAIISSSWNKVYSVMTGIVRKIINFFSSAFKWLVAKGQDLINGFIYGITLRSQAVYNAIKNVSDRIGRFFKGAGSWLYDTGAAIIRGLINGISSMAGSVYGKVQEIANSIKDRIKSALKIQSPSKVFYGYGQNIVQGLVDGLQNSRQLALTSMQSLVPDSTKLDQSSKAQQMSSNTSIYGNINIGNKQDADYFFNKLNRGQDLVSFGLASGDSR